MRLRYFSLLILIAVAVFTYRHYEHSKRKADCEKWQKETEERVKREAADAFMPPVVVGRRHRSAQIVFKGKSAQIV